MSTLLDTLQAGTRLDTDTDTDSGAEVPPPRGRWRPVVAAVSALVVVVCAAVLGWLLTTGGPAASAGDLTHADDREDVMSLGDQFVKRLGTYSPDMLDDSGQMAAYREQVREVITPKFAADFDKEVATAEQLVAQGGITRNADVFATAVSSIDDDSARVLVAGAFTDSYSQGAGQAEGQGEGEDAETINQEPLPFRFVIDLVLIEGEWLVDDFNPVGSNIPADDPGAPEGGGAGE